MQILIYIDNFPDADYDGCVYFCKAGDDDPLFDPGAPMEKVWSEWPQKPGSKHV